MLFEIAFNPEFENPFLNSVCKRNSIFCNYLKLKAISGTFPGLQNKLDRLSHCSSCTHNTMTVLKVVKNPRPHEPPFVLLADNQIIKEVFDFLKLLMLRGVSPRTLRAYAFDLLAFFRFLRKSALSINILQPKHTVEFLLSHREENLAPRTINRRLVTVRSFLNDQFDGLGEMLFLKTFPPFYRGRKNCALLGNSRLKGQRSSLRVKVPSIIIMPLTFAEIRKFMAGLRKYRDLAILYLMIFCGLRSCEVLSLETQDIDLIDNQIRVRGKGDKHRILPISPAVRKALLNHLNYERPECCHPKCFTVLKGPNRGLPLTPEGLRKLFRLQRSKSIKKAHPHLFRHTFATHLIQQGVSLPAVQKLLGHSDIEVTMGYLHLSLDDISKEYHQAIESLGPFDNFAKAANEDQTS